jgi:hypothetical protein
VEDAPLRTIKRRIDEPKLAVGDTVVLKDGTVGVVVARYIPSGHPDEVRYVLRVEGERRQKP